MMGIGFGEMVLIASIALIVFGPEKFPDFAKIAIRTINDLRGYVDEIQKEVSKEIKPIKRELEQMSKYDPEKYINALSNDVSNAAEKKPAPSTTPTDASSNTEESSGTSDPYMESQAGTSDTASTENSNDAPSQDSVPANNSNAEGIHDRTDDEWDLTDPPIERLD